jgi:hypothetical protein
MFTRGGSEKSQKTRRLKIFIVLEGWKKQSSKFPCLMASHEKFMTFSSLKLLLQKKKFHSIGCSQQSIEK